MAPDATCIHLLPGPFIFSSSGTPILPRTAEFPRTLLLLSSVLSVGVALSYPNFTAAFRVQGRSYIKQQHLCKEELIPQRG